DRHHNSQQRITLEYRVGIDNAHVRRGRGIETSIDRVRLAATRFFVNDNQFRGHITSIQSAYRRALEVRDIYCPDWPQAKLFAELFKSTIPSPIIDDDDLDLRIIQFEKIADRHANRSLFVVRRRNDRDRRYHRCFLQPVKPMAFEVPLMER